MNVVNVNQVLDESTKRDEPLAIPRIQRYAISAHGSDYPIDALYSRIKDSYDGVESDIYIPDFQRGYVWTKPQADRFIESILLGLPIPGIFLSKDEETSRLFVIDGSQRLRTIKFFMDGLFDSKEFVLGSNVHEDFRGRSYKSLSTPDRRDFNNTTIHAITIRQDIPEDDGTSIYYLFERLNTGGTPAQPHEVRRAIHQGPFDILLSELDKFPLWREIFGPPSKRFKDQELILRFLALRFPDVPYGEKYDTMKEFLTGFMARNRKSIDRFDSYRAAFEETVAISHAALGLKAFRPSRALNAALFDSVMVGLSERLQQGKISDLKMVSKKYEELLTQETYVDAISTGTSQPQKVNLRIQIAIQAFSEIR